MLTPEGCRARRARLWERLDPKVERVVLGLPRHITYFTGYYPNPFSYASQNASAVLILERAGKSTLIVDSVQKRLAENAHVDEVITAGWYNGKTTAPPRNPTVNAAALERLEGKNGNRLRVDSGVSTFLAAREQSAALDDLLLALSRAKDADELEVMRRSLKAMEAGYAAARRGIHAGMTELDAFSVVQRAATESAGHPVQVYGDFASGPHAEAGGGGPTQRVIERGDLLIIDYSVVIHGYRGDLASTWVVDGKPTPRQAEMVEACLAAMKAGEDGLKPGTPCREVDSALRSTFRERGLEAYFKHHSGHGVGLGHPDPPYIVPESSDVLVIGDIVTVEPGCYVPGEGGMRFEHNYLIIEAGFERLSNHPLAL